MKNGTEVLYGVRNKAGLFVQLRAERNPRDRYACCETSFYAYLPQSYSRPAENDDRKIWLLPSKDAILNAVTQETKYYNADSPEHPVIEFDMEDDELEIVRVTRTTAIEVEQP